MRQTIKQNIRLYPTNFVMDVVFGDVEYLKKIVKMFYEEFFDMDDIEDMSGKEGAVWSFVDEVEGRDTLKYLLWIKDARNIVTINHEIVHITWEVQRQTGIRMDAEAQEFQAYMHDYLLVEILNIASNDWWEEIKNQIN